MITLQNGSGHQFDHRAAPPSGVASGDRISLSLFDGGVANGLRLVGWSVLVLSCDAIGDVTVERVEHRLSWVPASVPGRVAAGAAWCPPIGVVAVLPSVASIKWCGTLYIGLTPDELRARF